VFGDDSGPSAAPIDDPVRVLICDEHDLVRRSLTAKLEESPRIEVVAEVASGGEAVAESLYVAPDLVFVSLVLPCLTGLQTVGLIADVMPGTEIIALAVEETDDERFAALRAGASGVIDKEQLLGSGESMIERLLVGLPFVAAESAALLLERFDGLVEGSAVAPLTGRERAVLGRVAAGAEATAIGDDLQMLIGEVRNHIVNVLQRLRAGAPLDLAPEAQELLATIGG
jgi:DNA-binding NarL/FixJ family response regulator